MPRPRRASRTTYALRAGGMALTALREGRLTLSPRRWLIDMRHLRGLMADEAGPSESQTGSDISARDRGQALADFHRLALAAFVQSRGTLRFAPASEPKVSVLLVLYNRAELTFRCLRALSEHTNTPLELIIVDNHSSDETPALLDHVEGPRIIRAPENLGFLRACNEAARAARGEHLLFLNNDAELLPGALAALVTTLDDDASIGAAGGRLILPDGRLQEAGSIIWNDGSCLGYGRGATPWAPEYSFTRDVDYCSAALLLTRRDLFLELGGFDDRFQPAYYEDADYCVRLWQRGRRVVYTPRASALHFEFSSSPSMAAAIEMQRERQRIFADRHREWLAGQTPPAPENTLRARDRHRGGLRILVIDDRVPRTSIGFGFPRAVTLLNALVRLGHFVTVFPTAAAADDHALARVDIDDRIEVMSGYGPRHLADFFRDRQGYYDCLLVSRPHNMALLRAKFGAPSQWMPGASVVYDAEAIAASREVGRRRLESDPMAAEESDRLVSDEIALADGVGAVLTVSADERRLFQRQATRVHVVSHAIEPSPTPRPFSERDGILFVGSFHELSPNADAALWFVREVLPLVRCRLGSIVRFTIVGKDPPRELTDLRADAVDFVGAVTDLTPLYDAARLFVAPTRFAAGIPYKIGHAAAHGLPVVATSLLAQQLGWRDGRELLVADSAEGFAACCVSLYRDDVFWAQVRESALARVAEEYSPDRFAAALEAALSAATGGAAGLS